MKLPANLVPKITATSTENSMAANGSDRMMSPNRSRDLDSLADGDVLSFATEVTSLESSNVASVISIALVPSSMAPFVSVSYGGLITSYF